MKPRAWLLLAGVAALIASAGVATRKLWNPPERAAPYLPILAKAERDNNIPQGLLVRVAHQESRFRPDIISGATKSHANAEGIMQIVRRWHPSVDPLDPSEAIPYAGEYLRQLYDQFGSWELALAGYNWGPGNVSKYPRSRWPEETQNYTSQILADVPTYSGGSWMS